MKQTGNRGKGIFFLFIILAALAGGIVSFFPLVELYLPNIAGKINHFRGYYTGPLFTAPATKADRYFTEKYHGFKTSMEKEQTFFFIPAADIRFDFSAFYEFTGNPIELYLFESGDLNSYKATSLTVPYATGRQADAFSQQGAEIPEHANWFSYECNEGILYALKIIPKTTGEIGKKFTVTLKVSEGWISLPGLWGLFVGLLFVLITFYFLIKILAVVRK